MVNGKKGLLFSALALSAGAMFASSKTEISSHAAKVRGISTESKDLSDFSETVKKPVYKRCLLEVLSDCGIEGLKGYLKGKHGKAWKEKDLYHLPKFNPENSLDVYDIGRTLGICASREVLDSQGIEDVRGTELEQCLKGVLALYSPVVAAHSAQHFAEKNGKNYVKTLSYKLLLKGLEKGVYSKMLKRLPKDSISRKIGEKLIFIKFLESISLIFDGDKQKVSMPKFFGQYFSIMLGDIAAGETERHTSFLDKKHRRECFSRIAGQLAGTYLPCSKVTGPMNDFLDQK
jgi:hypothetical protein